MKNYLIVILMFITVISCNDKSKVEIKSETLKTHLDYLASDSLQGRQPGTLGDSLAANYIKQVFRDAGLELLYHNGYQKFDVTVEASADTASYLLTATQVGRAGTDFVPAIFSANKEVTLQSGVFIDFGLQFDGGEYTWNSFANIDLQDKYACILLGSPYPDSLETNLPDNFFEARSKALLAQDNGAKAVIFMGGPANFPQYSLPGLRSNRVDAQLEIPVVYITCDFAKEFFDKFTPAGIEKQIMDEGKPKSVELKRIIELKTGVNFKKAPTHNVVARLNSTNPQKTDEWMLVGAHYDHLGMGGKNSGSRTPDTLAVHNGADDNASGVAAMLEMAEYLSDKTNKLKRDVVFAAFAAEEKGLIGSKYFADNLSKKEVENLILMMNLDMVGRLDSVSRKIVVSGIGTALGSDSILDLYNDSTLKLTIEKVKSGYGPSDHASFYALDVPVLYVSTGAHSDYHTPEDDVDFLDFEGMQQVTKYWAKIAEHYATTTHKPEFARSDAGRPTNHGRNMKVKLGIMPDFTGGSNNGLRIDAISEDGPAQQAGLQKKDIITAINGKKISNIYDYMQRLTNFSPGETITVDVLRGDEKLVILVQL